MGLNKHFLIFSLSCFEFSVYGFGSWFTGLRDLVYILEIKRTFAQNNFAIKHFFANLNCLRLPWSDGWGTNKIYVEKHWIESADCYFHVLHRFRFCFWCLKNWFILIPGCVSMAICLFFGGLIRMVKILVSRICSMFLTR